LIGAGGNLVIKPFLEHSLPFDPLVDLVPVFNVAEAPHILVVPSSIPAKDLAEFIAYARAHRARSTTARREPAARRPSPPINSPAERKVPGGDRRAQGAAAAARGRRRASRRPGSRLRRTRARRLSPVGASHQGIGNQAGVALWLVRCSRRNSSRTARSARKISRRRAVSTRSSSVWRSCAPAPCP